MNHIIQENAGRWMMVSIWYHHLDRCDVNYLPPPWVGGFKYSGQIIAPSHDRFPPKGSKLEGNSPAISGKSRWRWNIIPFGQILGNDPILTDILIRWVGSTTNEGEHRMAYFLWISPHALGTKSSCLSAENSHRSHDPTMVDALIAR